MSSTAASPAYSAPPSPQPQSLRPRKKMVPSSMSLAERNKEDDWTRVKDPKEKKRIQNRVAQRTYRELQARLDSHERRGLNQEACDSPAGSDAAVSWPSLSAHNGNEAPTATAGSTQRPLQTEIRNVSHNEGGHSKEESSQDGETRLLDNKRKPNATAVLSTESSPSPESADASFGGSFTSMLTAGMAGDEATSRLYGGPRSLLDDPSPRPVQGLVSPSARVSATRPVKIPQDFVLDCLRFQNHLLTQLSRIQQQQEQQDGGAARHADMVTPDDLVPSEHMASLDSLTPAHSDALDLPFHETTAMWDLTSLDASSPATDSMGFPPLMSSCHGEQRFPAAGPLLSCPLQPLALFHGQATTPASTPAPSPCQPPARGDCSLDQRIESVLTQAEAVGFDSFDQLATAYYCSTFAEPSPLATNQHQSRRRRLPRLVSDVFRATGQWTPWERRGFHDEVLKAAEALLRAEASDYNLHVP
ncbi:hypothetical protein CDD82_3374 [Ophiocordyceps australis]|uniref:BZIP domain-containing protein n=1 Tax=Ophiocordyceps australis TaxID=1399860 RepID=A0A2C5ZCL5_9HYPO|nr:hypothetical protein CDD82_3374 [Ophiocordyceps australis]